LLRPDVTDQVRGSVRVTVGMAVETRHAEARAIRAAVVNQVELLLRERRQQQAQTIELLGVQDALEQLEIVVGGDELPLRNVAQVRPCGEKDRRRKLGQELLGQIQIQI